MERYIEKITVKSKYFCFEKGLEIEFIEGINLIVGDQGCGKSTLLNGLHSQSKWLDIEISEYTRSHGVDSRYFDTEHQNPRTKQANPDSSLDIQLSVISHFESHGETLKRYTVDVIKKQKNIILLLDEPETALSIRNQFHLIDAMLKAQKNGCQLFVATHCLPLIEAVPNVYSLEHKLWMPSKQFVELNRI